MQPTTKQTNKKKTVQINQQQQHKRIKGRRLVKTMKKKKERKKAHQRETLVKMVEITNGVAYFKRCLFLFGILSIHLYMSERERERVSG